MLPYQLVVLWSLVTVEPLADVEKVAYLGAESVVQQVAEQQAAGQRQVVVEVERRAAE